MKAYSYVVVDDTGFAPNPFHGYCTLATCKPQIRLHAQPDDWILGMGSAQNVGHGKLIYAMRVDEVLTFDEYSRDKRFQAKVPKIPGTPEQECGDNIYRLAAGKWNQCKSFHRPDEMQHDLNGQNVLISEHFFYFGQQAIQIPQRFSELVCRGRGHRCRFEEVIVNEFLRWLHEKREPGLRGLPGNFQPTTLGSYEESGCKPKGKSSDRRKCRPSC